MHVAMLSKALVVAAYRNKCDVMAPLVTSLTAFVPPAWGSQQLEPGRAQGYELRVIPVRLNGSFHAHHYPSLRRELRAWAAARPGGELRLVHIDEEPYNLATMLALRAARAARARAIFFTWQNLHRRYPPPFAWFERRVFSGAEGAIAGSAEAASVLRAKGYRGAIEVIPQFGVDDAWLRIQPPPTPHAAGSGDFVLGFAGRLVEEKGADMVLTALAGAAKMRARIAGVGPQRAALEALARQLGITERVEFVGALPSSDMPAFYAGLDALAVPSRTRPNWKEQFGRVLAEAMALGVPVMGAMSGEIPHVIGDAGLLFAEGAALELRAQACRLRDEPELRAALRTAGRARVRARYTMERIAELTVQAYASIAGG